MIPHPSLPNLHICIFLILNYPTSLEPLEKELPKQLRNMKAQNALFSVPFRSIVLIFLMK